MVKLYLFCWLLLLLSLDIQSSAARIVVIFTVTDKPQEWIDNIIALTSHYKELLLNTTIR